MNFSQFLQYPFTGRMSRTQYFWVSSLLVTLNKTLNNAEFDSVILGWVTFFISFVILFYQQVVVVRRLHDFNYSGWFVLFHLTPVLIVSIFLI